MSILIKKEQEDRNDLLFELPDFPEEASYFGKGLNIKGDISGEECLHVDGAIEGNIDLNDDLQVNKSATINGNVKANTITSCGFIKGNITAITQLHLDETAKVNGKITTPSVSISEGAIFDGEMDMDKPK